MKRFVKAIKMTYNKLHENEFKVGACMRKEDFTRNRKMDFTDFMLLILKGTKKSMQAIVNEGLKEFHMEQETYSKQAFSKGRQRINPEAFLQLFNDITESFYEDDSFKRYKGFRVMAIDGTKYNLPNTPELLEIYGSERYSNDKIQVQAQGSCLYDVLNEVLMDIKISPFNTSERELAKLHIKSLNKFNPQKELVLMDRGYPSCELIDFINNEGINFLFRSNKNEFIKELRDASGNDVIITHAFKDKATKKIKTFSLRAISILLDTGVTETLITNVFDENFTAEDFKYLYNLRWGIETKYDDFKNKLQIENFSGITPIAILQDFYATMYLSNMAAFAQLDCAEELEKKLRTKELKYEYKINVSMTVSILKDEFIKACLEPSNRKRDKMVAHIMKQLLQCVVPIRNGRNFDRTVQKRPKKFPPNRKNL